MFVGIGILVIPNAFVNGGLALTSVFLVLITLTFTHGMMQVVSCLSCYPLTYQFIIDDSQEGIWGRGCGGAGPRCGSVR